MACVGIFLDVVGDSRGGERRVELARGTTK
jgi:hypothetical protein